MSARKSTHQPMPTWPALLLEGLLGAVAVVGRGTHGKASASPLGWRQATQSCIRKLSTVPTQHSSSRRSSLVAERLCSYLYRAVQYRMSAVRQIKPTCTHSKPAQKDPKVGHARLWEAHECGLTLFAAS